MNMVIKFIFLTWAIFPITLMGQSWSPSDGQNREVVRLYGDYYSVKDGGNYKQAYTYLSPSTKQLIPFDRWVEITSKSKAGMGEVEVREIKKITWYNNPEGSESPGIYAAIDFVGRSKKANIYCGFVIWKEVANGDFVLLREEQNYIDKDNEVSLREQGKFEELKEKFGC